MNPFLIENTKSDDELPELVMEAWDFENDHFLLDGNGNPKQVTRNEAVKVWIYKALKTERTRYEIYNHGQYNEISLFGVELEQFIGKNPNNELTAQKIKEFVYEGLIINPYIQEIKTIDIIEITKDKTSFHIELTTIYGSMEVYLVV